LTSWSAGRLRFLEVDWRVETGAVGIDHPGTWNSAISKYETVVLWFEADDEFKSAKLKIH